MQNVAFFITTWIFGGKATSKHHNVKCTGHLRNVLIQTNWAKANAGVNYHPVAEPASKIGMPEKKREKKKKDLAMAEMMTNF